MGSKPARPNPFLDRFVRVGCREADEDSVDAPPSARLLSFPLGRILKTHLWNLIGECAQQLRNEVPDGAKLQ